MFYIRVALRNFENNKLRLWLNIISIIAGITLLVLILTLSAAFKSALYDEMKISDERVLTIAISNSPSSLNYVFLPVFDDEDIKIVSSKNHVTNCEGMFGAFATQITARNAGGGETSPLLSTTIYGSNEGLLSLYGTEIAKGQYPTADDEILIGAVIAESYHLDVGDSITVWQGEGSHEFTITGIANKLIEQAYSTTPTMMNNILLTLKTAPVFASEAYICIIASVDDANNIRSVADDLSAALNAHNDSNLPSNASVTVLSRLDALEMIDGWFVLVNIFIALLFLIVSVIVILNLSNMMVMTILQRTKEIGVLKIIGGQAKQIAAFYIAECCIIGAIGTLLGIVLSVLLAFIFGAILSWTILIEPVNILYVVLVGIGCPLIAGVLTQRRIDRLDPIVAFNE